LEHIFKSLTSGFARFVFAWIPPSLISVGTFVIFLWPTMKDRGILRSLSQSFHGNTLVGLLIFAFVVMTVSILSAYSALPIYQVLEGYSLPSFLKKPLLRRQQKRFIRIRAAERRYVATEQLPHGIAVEDFRSYPDDLHSVRATRLGNALTAMEAWGRDRYSLDSQTMWYELAAVSSSSVRQDVEEMRGPVDFFVSAITNMCVLLVTCVVAEILVPASRVRSSVIAVAAVLVAIMSYRLALRNALQWSQSVKAMVNLGRISLATSLGLQLPPTLEAEREMWGAHYWTVEFNQREFLPQYNSFRQPPPPPRSPATIQAIVEQSNDSQA
jgi:hypothetical protein